MPRSGRGFYNTNQVFLVVSARMATGFMYTETSLSSVLQFSEMAPAAIQLFVSG
jgi:hypothetical protein